MEARGKDDPERSVEESPWHKFFENIIEVEILLAKTERERGRIKWKEVVR